MACLYLVATPIGNLGDISPRALEMLTAADFIAAEDTRVTRRLLMHFGIDKPVVSYYEFNKERSGEAILARLLAGESCALVSDAGTPAVSDPGEPLVRLCAAHGIQVTAIPGPCAAICALTLSGLDTSRFLFEGFLPTDKKRLEERLTCLTRHTCTFILYEAPHRLLRTLEALASCLGSQRRIAVCRELTKLHEEVLRLTLGEAVAHFTQREPRGEFVLVLEGGVPAKEAPFWEAMSVQEHIAHYEQQGRTRMEAVKQTAKDRGVPKNEIYMQTLR